MWMAEGRYRVKARQSHQVEEAMTEIFSRKTPYPLGAHKEGGKLRFAFVSKKSSCGILLFDKATGREIDKVSFLPEERVGNIYCKTIDHIDAAKITYQFYEEDKPIPDERARVFPGRLSFGRERAWSAMKAGFPVDNFDWKEDRPPRIPYDQALVYCMHVRGFTKHASSNVKYKGTFAGILEKLPYLKEIGVTTLELQPAYEFLELSAGEEQRKLPYGVTRENTDIGLERKLNYWGYKKGCYYAPKAAYAISDDPTTEFKTLVRTLHENKMELVMQFYFPGEVKRSEIPEILRFWVLEYHVDGFHLMGENLPAEQLAADDALADTKLWYYRFDTDVIYEAGEQPGYPHVAEYNDAWYYDMRRYLKGDEGMLNSVLYHLRHIPEKAGCIHYLTNYSGFTLADLVSYDQKHNEANGEENRDGSDYNCSWNCGEEGTAHRKKTKQLRIRQMKNAMCLLLLSQSTPLIFMGDEFGNSQRGNNNPYCQDNAVAWLDWGCMKKNEELLAFWKKLVSFRSMHPILHPVRELRLMDDLACGYPDLSYHGQNAWRPQTESYYRHVGVLLCEKYAGRLDEEDGLLYLAMNMHWESHELALPRPPKGKCWKLAFSTDAEEDGKEKETGDDGQGEKTQAGGEKAQAGSDEQLLCRIPPRSISVYVSSSVCGKKSERGTKKAMQDPIGTAKQEK